jgi:hypothetical protein
MRLLNYSVLPAAGKEKARGGDLFARVRPDISVEFAQNLAAKVHPKAVTRMQRLEYAKVWCFLLIIEVRCSRSNFLEYKF